MKMTHSFARGPAVRPAGGMALGVALACVLLLAPIAHAAALPAGVQTALDAHASDAAFAALQQATERSVAAGAHEELVRSLIEQIKAETLPASTAAAWLDNTARLGQAGLPLNAVLSDYVQGVAKGYPAARIEEVIGGVETRLRDAAALVDAVAPGLDAHDPSRLASIDHTAWVLGLGVSKEDVARSLSLARQETAPADAARAPVLTLGMLVASGLSPETSFDVVNTAWTKGYRAEPLERLGKALAEANPSGGAPPAHLVNEVLTLLDREPSQDRFFEGLDDLMGREGYRMPSIGIDEDPLNRRDRGRIKDPIRSIDNERPGIGG
jgi:hypothetical protein